MQLFYPLGLPSDNIGIHGFHDTIKNQSQSYIPITGCVLSHILSSSQLSSLEKMYYILADSISYINSSKGCNSSVSLPAKSWAERLACSKSEVFILQKSLEDKGYFIICRDKNDNGQNNRNTITTTIPDLVFNDLKYEPDRFNLNSDCEIDDKTSDYSQSNNLDSIDKTFIPTLEGKRQHLAKTKMFIRVPYQFLKELNSNCNISATSKVVLLYLFTKMYKSSVSKYDHDRSGSRYDYSKAVDYSTQNSNSIVTSYQELQQEFKLHRNSLTKALKTLETADLIKRDQIVIKSDNYDNSRADKSLWRISLVNASRITNDSTLYEQTGQIESDEQEEQFDKQQIAPNTLNTTIHTDDQKNVVCKNKALKPFIEKGCTKYDPPCTDSGQLYIKNFILKNSINKNVDYIDENCEDFKNSSVDNSQDELREPPTTKNTEINHKEKLFRNEKSSFLSESYNNSSFLNDSCKGKNISEEKEIRYFYPLSEQDISTLNFKANREFSSNFINQLLLKLYIKYPEKRFKNKFTFLSYMVQILANEKHQGPLVNHTSFRFSCNINTEEKSLLEYEKYLNQIESSFDTSKETLIRKKIAGRFSTEIAYKILTQVEFKENHDHSFVTALVPSNLTLSERQTEILSDQLEAVYGMNSSYVQILEEISNNLAEEKLINTEEQGIIQTFSKIPQGVPLNAIPSTSAWHAIRKGLIEELGEAIDTAWFSKAAATEYSKTATLILTMPTRFMADWIKNNYAHVIMRLAGSVGVKRVGYRYELQKF